MAPPIVLMTDFGLTDPFVGVMKGVVLQRFPGANVVDLTHHIPPQNVRVAAFHLMVSAPYFPVGSIFVSVVDPGVGSERRILWAKGESRQFLAPDNGLISWVRERLVEIRQVTNRALALPQLSSTFHGRDVFAPVAAELANGLDPKELGPQLKEIKRLDFPEPKSAGGKTSGSVLAIDRFGNAITNLTAAHLDARAAIGFKGTSFGALKTHYSAVEESQPVALIGSFGFVELAVRNGSFAQRYGAAIGDAVEANYVP